MNVMCMYVFFMHLCGNECATAFLWSEDRSWLSALLETRSLFVVGLLRCPLVDLQASRDTLVSTAEMIDLCAMWITFIWVLDSKSSS